VPVHLSVFRPLLFVSNIVHVNANVEEAELLLKDGNISQVCD
jgi:hypothetical protein